MRPTTRPTNAIVRPPSAAFANALSTHVDAPSIDPDRARQQHHRYVEKLRQIGLDIVVLELDGGDVLALADRLVVGRSDRTNNSGIEVLRGFAEPLGQFTLADGGLTCLSLLCSLDG